MGDSNISESSNSSAWAVEKLVNGEWSVFYVSINERPCLDLLAMLDPDARQDGDYRIVEYVRKEPADE